MTESELNSRYFEWMCQLVEDERRSSYQKLLKYLDSVVFKYTLAMDGNRADDGIDLRYRFGYENRHESSAIASYLDNRPCSVLEMLVALAFRCEEHIMTDPDVGNRMGQWFWGMVDSLGLNIMTDDYFSSNYTNHVINQFEHHKYARDGKGGLFTIKHCKYDMRSVEIWTQMNWYLDSIL